MNIFLMFVHVDNHKIMKMPLRVIVGSYVIYTPGITNIILVTFNIAVWLYLKVPNIYTEYLHL